MHWLVDCSVFASLAGSLFQVFPRSARDRCDTDARDSSLSVMSRAAGLLAPAGKSLSRSLANELLSEMLLVGLCVCENEDAQGSWSELFLPA